MNARLRSHWTNARLPGLSPLSVQSEHLDICSVTMCARHAVRSACIRTQYYTGPAAN